MLPDKTIEIWMGQVLYQMQEQNKKLKQIKILLASPPGGGNDLLSAIGGLGGDLSPKKLIKKAAAEVDKKDKEDEDQKKAESTHVEHKCPACEHGHVWDLHPYTEPGSTFVEFVRSEEDRKNEPQEDEPVHLTEAGITAFVESQLCTKCGTPMTAYIDSSRAALPVISVAKMYGLDTKNNPPAAAAGAAKPTVTPPPKARKKPAPAAKKAAPGAKKKRTGKKRTRTRKKK